MSIALSKTGARIGLLMLLLLAAWLGYFQSSRNSDAVLQKIVQELRSEGPWYYRLANQTHTLQLLPRKWSQPVQQLNIQLKRKKGVNDLTGMGTNAWPAVPALLRMVTHKNRSVGLSAGEALAGIKAEEHPEWGKLQGVLVGQSAAAEIFLYMVVGMNDSGRSYDVAYRRFGLIGLAATGPAAAKGYSDLIRLLKFDNEPDLRASAVIALGGIDTERQNILPLLRTIAQDKEEWPKVSAAAVQALGSSVPAAPETLSLLHDALEDQRALVRLSAARTLWNLKAPSEKVLPVLTTLLDHKLPSIRSAALNGIADMGSAARESQGAVQRLNSDENESVRRSAQAALKSITLN